MEYTSEMIKIIWINHQKYIVSQKVCAMTSAKDDLFERSSEYKLIQEMEHRIFYIFDTIKFILRIVKKNIFEFFIQLFKATFDKKKLKL